MARYTASMPLLPSALPPKGEARRYVANDFLNLIAFPSRARLFILAAKPPSSFLIRVELSSPIKGRHTPRANPKTYFYKENLFYDKSKRL